MEIILFSNKATLYAQSGEASDRVGKALTTVLTIARYVTETHVSGTTGRGLVGIGATFSNRQQYDDQKSVVRPYNIL